MVYAPPDLSAYTAHVAALPEIQEFYLRMSMEEYDYWKYVNPTAQEIGNRVATVGERLAIPISDYTVANAKAIEKELRDAVEATVLFGLDDLEAEGYIQPLSALTFGPYVIPHIGFEASPLVVRKLVDHLVTPL